MYEYEINLIQRGEPRKALESLLSQVPMRNQDPALFVNMAIAFEDLGELDRAERGYRFVIDRWPGNIEAMNNLVNFLVKTGRVDEAATWAQKAAELTPDGYCLHAIGMVRIEQLQIDSALAHFKAAAELAGTAPSPAAARAWSDYLGYSLHTGYDAAAHRDWVNRFGEVPIDPATKWDGKRPLHVAYIGDVFRNHACAHMLEPVLAAHDPAAVLTIIYSDNPVSDSTTDRLKALAGGWNDTAGLSDDALYTKLCRDEIDVIIDLQGHKQRSRLLALCQNIKRPAPIMLGYLGYAGDTLVTDNIDQLVGWAYRPADDAPPVSALPRLHNGYITFGSVHRPAKLNKETLNCWGWILSNTPGSKLRVSVNGGEANKSARETLTGHGIAGDQIELVSRPAAHADYLKLADSIDVHLDTFPYGGGATTCDMLWQGVPSIVLAGGKYSMGEYLMRSAGLGSFVAKTEDEYISIAQSIGENLATIRQGLRVAMGPLLDGAPVARRIESECARRAKGMQSAKAAEPVPCCD